MALPRVIPVLLIRNKGLVKTLKFKDDRYIGDPVNAVKIFNEKEVDELIVLDIEATPHTREPQYDFLREIVSECFSPMGYGGGIKNLQQIQKLIQTGIEKIIINTACIVNPSFLKEATENFGSSTIVAAMDVKKNFFGKYTVYSHGGTKNTGLDPLKHAQKVQELGGGELFVNNIDHDGTMSGYDHSLIHKIAKSIDIPVIACGGAADVDDLIKVLKESGASAAAAGSLFVFHGKHKAVLITYPEYRIISEKLGKPA
jgi:cyclase